MQGRFVAIAMAAAVSMSGMVFAQFGGLGGQLKDVAKGAAETAAIGVVQKQINNNLTDVGCAFKGNSTETTCDLTKVLATLKAGQTLAKQNKMKTFDFDVNAEVCGKGGLQDQRVSKMEEKLKLLFKGWDFYVKRGGKGDCLNFTVDID